MHFTTFNDVLNGQPYRMLLFLGSLFFRGAVSAWDGCTHSSMRTHVMNSRLSFSSIYSLAASIATALKAFSDLKIYPLLFIFLGWLSLLLIHQTDMEAEWLAFLLSRIFLRLPFLKRKKGLDFILMNLRQVIYIKERKDL